MKSLPIEESIINISVSKIKNFHMITVIVADVQECEIEGICQNGGTCTELLGSYDCNCATGYEGTNCETGWFVKQIFLLGSKGVHPARGPALWF